MESKFTDADVEQFKAGLDMYGLDFLSWKDNSVKVTDLLHRLECAEAWGKAEYEHRLNLESNTLRTQRLADEAHEAWLKSKGES